MRKCNFFIFLILAVLLGGFFWWRWGLGAKDSQIKTEKNFVVKKGETLRSVAERLEEENLIRNSFVFRLFVWVKGKEGKIQAGNFKLSPSFDIEKILEILVRGPQGIWLTFPEGWRKEEFARRLAANLENFSYEEFIFLAKDSEGYLFPDTYLISKQASPSSILKIFIDNFEKKISGEIETEIKKKGFTRNQILILASLVERETKFEEDRPLVAGILIKRWKNNWPLQVDASVQYGLANLQMNFANFQLENWWPKITKKDLEIDSPYNTYKYRGLPPAPICNPGLASIKAVLFAKESPYWFYLSDNEGKIYYAKTLEEHNQNIKKYRY